MSNIVSFLEKMGSDASLRFAEPSKVKAELDQQAISAEQQDAIFDSNGELLNKLANAPEIVSVIILPAEDEPEPEQQPDEEETANAKQVCNF